MGQALYYDAWPAGPCMLPVLMLLTRQLAVVPLHANFLKATLCVVHAGTGWTGSEGIDSILLSLVCMSA